MVAATVPAAAVVTVEPTPEMAAATVVKAVGEVSLALLTGSPPALAALAVILVMVARGLNLAVLTLAALLVMVVAAVVVRQVTVQSAVLAGAAWDC